MTSHAPDAHDPDADLLADLRAALADTKAIPQRHYDAAEAAFSWRTIDEELESLSLIDDSAMQQSSAMRASQLDAPRVLTFEGSTLSIEVEVAEQRIAGQVIPEQAAHIRVVTPSGAGVEADADDFGCFILEWSGSGPIRLQCSTAEAELITEWTIF